MSTHSDQVHIGSQSEQITISSGDAHPSKGQIQIRDFSSGERLGRAILRGGIGLALTIVAIFIPIAHFVLVPLGLLVSVLLVISAMNQSGVIESGTATCPSCNATISIYRRSKKFPFTDICESCHRSVTIQRV